MIPIHQTGAARGEVGWVQLHQSPVVVLVDEQAVSSLNGMEVFAAGAHKVQIVLFFLDLDGELHLGLDALVEDLA